MKYYDTFISNTPEPYDRWHDAMQALIDKTFTNSSTYQKSGIEEEIAFGTLEFKPVICRVTTLIDATTGQRVNDDYRKIIFSDIKHCPELGTRYRFENNIWIVYSLENILTATSSVYVRRCNNTINTEDKYGNIHKEPCVIDYKINETQLQRSTEMEVANSRLQVFCQDNVYSDRVSINNRFIFGSSVYKIRSRGDYDLRETFNSESQKIINFYVDLDNISDDDRFDLGIANYVEHNYTAIIPTSNIENVIGFTGKLNAQILLDGEETDEEVIWESTSPSVAEIDPYTGEFKLLKLGECGFIATMVNKPDVTSAVQVKVSNVLPMVSKIVIDPVSKFVKLNARQTFSVYEYVNNVATNTVFTFTFSGANSRYYKISDVDGNHFTVLNLRPSDERLIVSCVSDTSDTRITEFEIELGGLV